MDITKYLNRIGYKSTYKTGLANLKALQSCHLLNVPFENLDIHNKIPILLDTNRFFGKIVENNRGGFCYELNGLFYELLRELGFDVKMISARVFDKEKGYGPEFDHMALIVTIENNEYLTDVGFGKFSAEPLQIIDGVIQSDPVGNFIIEKHDDINFRVSAVSNNSHTPQYIFSKKQRDLNEFEGMCRYHQTSPQSHFTQKRIISKQTPDGRVSLADNKLKISVNDSSKEITLHNSEEHLSALWKYFNISEENLFWN